MKELKLKKNLTFKGDMEINRIAWKLYYFIYFNMIIT